MLCAKCGSANADGVWFCAKCGVKLVADQGPVPAAVPVRPMAPAAATEPSATASTAAATLDGFDEEAWRAAIGPNNTDYYLSRFEAFHDGAGGGRWHWPAFFMTFWWLLYRKLWGWALLYFLLPWIVLLPIGLAAGAMGAAGAAFVGALWLLFVGATWFVPPLVANRLYYARCRHLINRQRGLARSREQLLAQVEARGGTSMVAAIVLGVVMVIGVIGMLAAVALPAYNDYVKRARVAEALLTGKQAAQLVGDYYRRTGNLPAQLEQLPTAVPQHKLIRSMQIDASTGELHIDVALGGRDGGKFYFVPGRGEGGALSWSCRASPEVVRFAPSSCR